MPTYPIGWMPPTARTNPEAQAWWKKDPVQRAGRWLILGARPVDVQEELAALMLSFTYDNLDRAIRERLDLWPVMVDIGRFEDPILGPLAKTVMRRNGTLLMRFLCGPNGEGPVEVLKVVEQIDPKRGAMLRSPRGWDWMRAASYVIAYNIYVWAGLPGRFWYSPPPNVQLNKIALPSGA